VMLVCRFEARTARRSCSFTGRHGSAALQRRCRRRVRPGRLVAPGASFVLGDPSTSSSAVEAWSRLPRGATRRRQTLVEDGRDGGAPTRVADTVDLRGFLMGYGDALEVVGPPPLRAYFEEQAENLARLYGRPSQRPPPPPDLRVRARRRATGAAVRQASRSTGAAHGAVDPSGSRATRSCASNRSSSGPLERGPRGRWTPSPPRAQHSPRPRRRASAPRRRPNARHDRASPQVIDPVVSVPVPDRTRPVPPLGTGLEGVQAAGS
jgi:hypothetical protein